MHLTDKDTLPSFHQSDLSLTCRPHFMAFTHKRIFGDPINEPLGSHPLNSEQSSKQSMERLPCKQRQ